MCAGGSSSGLSPSLLLLFAECWRQTLARTALSRMTQVIRLSHNFIVYFSPTAEHGASRNQQVSPGKRGEQHRGCLRATPGLQLLTVRPQKAQNGTPGLFINQSDCTWKTECPPSRGARPLRVPAHHQSSPRSLGAEERSDWEPGSAGDVWWSIL